MHPQTLRMYEARGLITPKRSPKNTRLYSYEDVERLRRIQQMTADDGLNLAGVETVLGLERELERARVGDAGLFEIADRAGMTRFTVAGYWGNAQVAAGDLARFFGDLDRVFVKRHREYAKGLLGSIIDEQRWGIPTAAGDKWAVRFKGGWLPDHALAHQAAELRERHGPRALDRRAYRRYAVIRLRDGHGARDRRPATQSLVPPGRPLRRSIGIETLSYRP